ncbi:diaminopimelate decarboxylase [Longispora sp. NPDC051575]|uniref:diaminopimelate decarboxylase n=1 Tax=Longispora sp. NPDC051575 TaxID=3154943 RepID=UPI00344463DA
MTLTDILPSLRSSLPSHPHPEIWPVSTTAGVRGEVAVGGVSLTDLADRYGTPAYVLDETDVRHRCAAYDRAFGAGNVVYAAKALTCRALLRWIASEGLGLAVYSAGQLAAARSVDFPAERVVLHGDAKTTADLDAALDYGVGRIVIESPSEIARIAAAARPDGQRVLVRVLPEELGYPECAALPAPSDRDRFGLPAAELDDLVGRIVAQQRLRLVGLDIYLGSQLSRFGPAERAIRHLVVLLDELRRRHGVTLTELNIGGGHAVAHVHGEAELALDAFAVRVRTVLHAACLRLDVPEPRLMVTPGRAVVARAGVAVYRVLAVRRTADGHQLAAVDGGLSDNPRPALYGARYTATLLGRAGTATRPTTVVGRHDEVGDVLVRDTPLSSDLRPGDLIAVPASGAYQYAMASNYNLVTRPPLIGVRDGEARVLVRAETLADLLGRDVDA